MSGYFVLTKRNQIRLRHNGNILVVARDQGVSGGRHEGRGVALLGQAGQIFAYNSPALLGIEVRSLTSPRP